MSLLAGISQVKEFISSCFVCLPQFTIMMGDRVYLDWLLPLLLLVHMKQHFWIVLKKITSVHGFFHETCVVCRYINTLT